MNKKKKIYLSFIIFSIIMIIATVNKTKTLKEIEKNVTFAYYVDGVKTTTFPSKDSGYTLSEESNCTNGVSVSWDQFKWKALFKFNEFNMEKETRTKCTLYFVPYFPIPIKEYLFDLKDNTEELIEDNTNDKNLRYVGASPNNYILYNNELWRIIGVMNNVEDENGTVDSRVKIIRNESIGSYSLSGNESNDWSKSDMMKLLNPGYEENSVNNSLYWNKNAGKCYLYHSASDSSEPETCDFTTNGLTIEAKQLIATVKWPLGGSATEDQNVKEFYEKERGTEITENNSKNWIGNIGLIYPSDYGYATNGSENVSKFICNNASLGYWQNSSGLVDCINNAWIKAKTSEGAWTMHHDTSYNSLQFKISKENYISSNGVENSKEIYPVLFLNESAEISGGEGTKEKPYLLKSIKVKPEANFTITKDDNSINVDASTSISENKIVKYYYSTNNKDWTESTSSTHVFTEVVKEEINYGNAVETINSVYNHYATRVFVKVEDEVGNISDVKVKLIEGEEMANDKTEDKNIRYVGANPNNYVDFNGEKWRIIGIMNNIDDGNGNKEQRIKIIRDESIGKYSFDTSTDKSTNLSYGTSNWSTSKLMKLLNNGYNSESIGGSLYWNRANGTCYVGSNNYSNSCDFTSTGLTTDAKNMIDNAVWNLGGTDSNGWRVTTQMYYTNERNNNVYEGHDSTWTGKVGLMYPSDYGFSTSGNETTSRSSCLEKSLYDWDSDDCALNSWIYNNKNGRESLLHPASETIYNIFVIQESGDVSLWNEECSAFLEDTVSKAQTVRPVVYLKNSVKITSGTGTKEDSFQLSLN